MKAGVTGGAGESVREFGLESGQAWDSLRVSAVQFPLEGGHSLESFLAKVETRLKRAQVDGAQLVVFPELFTADLLPAFSPTPIGLEAEVREWNRTLEWSPRIFEAFERMASENGVAALFGTVPRRVGDQVLNTAPLFIPTSLSGVSRAQTVFQDKLFLTPCEDREWKWANGSRFEAIDAPWGPTAITICHDTEVPWLSGMLVERAPELILAPSCTGSVHGLQRVRWTALARSVEHHCVVVQTSTVGTGPGTINMNEHYGQAAILPPSESPYDRYRREGEANADAIVTGEVPLRLLRRLRRERLVWPARDQRERGASSTLPLWER